MLLRGRYHIIRRLSGGGFGDTYLAKDEDLPSQPLCVVKHLKPKNYQPDVLPIARRYFEREAAVLYRLNHEQIPKLLAHFEENGEFYLVQDYIDGNDLSQTELMFGKQLRESEVIKLLQEILEVLSFVHQQNTIHRDVKPSNLMRRRHDGKLFLIDFGAVKEIESLGTERQQTVAFGTEGYMPSEQYNGYPELASDVYAVGAIAIQALTGIMPHQLPRDPRTLEIVWRDKFKVSAKLANVIDKMVRYNGRERYPSAVEALQAVKDLAVTPWQRGQKIALPLVLSTALLTAIGSAIVWIKQPKPKPTVFLEYQNRQSGIEIEYPNNWEIIDHGGQIVPPQFEFIAPADRANDKFQERLAIAIEQLQEPLTLEAYSQRVQDEIERDNKIIDRGYRSLAGNRAYFIVYTSQQDDSTLKKMEVGTLKNFKAYAITYIAEAEQYDRYLNIAEKMINSLEIKLGG